MRDILNDLKRAVSGRAFLYALFGMMLCIAAGVFTDILSVLRMNSPEVMPGYHNELILKALSGDVILFAVPILAAIPYTASFAEDVRSGFMKPILTRTSVSKYLLGKGIACAVSGGLVLSLGILLMYLVFFAAFSPIEVFGEFAVKSRAPEVMGKLLLFFLSGAFWASVGLYFSTLKESASLAYAAPFIIYYILIMIQERYLRSLFILNPRNWLTLKGDWPLGAVGAIVFTLLALAAVQLLFNLSARKKLSEDDSRGKLYTGRGSSLKRLEKRIARSENRKPAKRLPIIRDFSNASAVVRYNFRMWRGNMRVILSFALAFVLCFLLSDKAVKFAYEMDTTMQAFEAFVWTFGDANSVLLVSLLLVLLFADVPFLGAGVPYYLVRMKRSVWAWGQLVYILIATFIYMLFIFAATTLICMKNSFIGNKWSETAAILGFSGAGKEIALPALIKTLEMSRPYKCAATIFLLMLMYTLVLSLIMLLLKIRHGRAAGIAGAFGFSLYGFLLNPELFKRILRLPEELRYKANVLCGWLSPLNHATYHMHNFGYDLLPRLWQTYAVFGGLILILMIGILLAIRRYNFTFLGTENT